MDETRSATFRPPPTGPSRRVTRRRFLAGAATTTLVWAAPAVVKLHVALPQAVVSPPPGSRDDRSDRTDLAGARQRPAGREPAPRPDSGPRVEAHDGRTVDAAAAPPAGTVTDAWKLAGTAAVGLTAGSWTVWGPDRASARPEASGANPPDGG